MRHFIGIDPSLVGHAVVVVGEDAKILYVHGWTDKKTLSGRFPEWLSFYKIGEQS